MRRLYFSLGKNKFWEYVLLALFLLFFYGPLMNMLLLSFAGDYEYPDVIPRSYGFKWWDYVLSKAQLVQSIGTSLVLAVVVTLLSLAVCLPAAYALARYPFRGRSAVRLSFLLTNAFPKMGIYTAMAVIFYKLNLIGTFAGVVLVHIVNTMMFMVWIPSGAFRTVHIQQEESARDVGASPLRTFLMVTLPMAKPGIIVASLYTFLGSMEEAQGSLLIGLPNVHTMPSELYGIIMSFPDTAGAVFADDPAGAVHPAARRLPQISERRRPVQRAENVTRPSQRRKHGNEPSRYQAGDPQSHQKVQRYRGCSRHQPPGV